MEETENHELVDSIRIGVERQIESWEDSGITDEELLKVLCIQAAMWCQAIAELRVPMSPEDKLYAKVDSDSESVTITVTKNENRLA